MVAQAVATIALILLIASGIAKLGDPTPTTGALRAVGLPMPVLLTYLVATAEVALAVIAMASGAPATLLAAFLYIGFAGFVVVAIRRKLPIQSCGCFGKEDTPPSYTHVGFNLVAAGSLIWLNFAPAHPIDWDMPGVALALFVGFAAAGAYASYLLLSLSPQLNAGRLR